MTIELLSPEMRQAHEARLIKLKAVVAGRLTEIADFAEEASEIVGLIRGRLATHQDLVVIPLSMFEESIESACRINEIGDDLRDFSKDMRRKLDEIRDTVQELQGDRLARLGSGHTV